MSASRHPQEDEVDVSNKGHEGTDNNRHRASGGSKPWRFIEVTGVVLILFYTIFQGLQLLIGRDNSIRQLRAYIGSTNVAVTCCTTPQSVTGTTVMEGNNYIAVTIRNNGTTPAGSVSTHAYYTSFPYSILFPLGFQYPEHQTVANIASSQLILSQQEVTSRIPIDNQTGFNGARQHNDRMIIYGNIDYDDIFERRRQSQFCVIWWIDLGGGEHTDWCSEHNDQNDPEIPRLSRLLYGP